jgi:hypothetical protein
MHGAYNDKLYFYIYTNKILQITIMNDLIVYEFHDSGFVSSSNKTLSVCCIIFCPYSLALNLKYFYLPP